MSKNRLLPCPFCGSSKVAIEEADDFLFYVECAKCGSKGANSTDADQAVENWNKRNNNNNLDALQNKANKMWSALGDVTATAMEASDITLSVTKKLSNYIDILKELLEAIKHEQE